jgi:hypothetical protein
MKRLIRAATYNHKEYNNNRSLLMYNITQEEAELAQAAYEFGNAMNGTDTDEGVRKYIELSNMIMSAGTDDSILYDLAADFSWTLDWEAIIQELGYYYDNNTGLYHDVGQAVSNPGRSPAMVSKGRR